MERFAVFPDVLSGRAVLVPHQVGAGVELGLGPADDPEKTGLDRFYQGLKAISVKFTFTKNC